MILAAMPKVMIVYYSRTGTTRKLAEALAGRLNADVVEIRCDRYKGGIFRYLRAGYDSVKGNLPPIKMPETDLTAYDLVLLGAPIWTSYPALPLRAFLAAKPDLPGRVGMFLTSGGHSPQEKAVAEAEALLNAPLAATLAVQEKDVKEGNFSDAMVGLVEEVVPGGGAA